MKNFINWLVYSSENPQSFSLTLKGAVATLLPVVILLVQQLGFTLDVANTEAFILSVISILTTAVTLIGLIRKLINTYLGKEVVVFTKKTELSTVKSPKKVAKKKVK